MQGAINRVFSKQSTIKDTQKHTHTFTIVNTHTQPYHFQETEPTDLEIDKVTMKASLSTGIHLPVKR